MGRCLRSWDVCLRRNVWMLSWRLSVSLVCVISASCGVCNLCWISFVMWCVFCWCLMRRIWSEFLKVRLLCDVCVIMGCWTRRRISSITFWRSGRSNFWNVVCRCLFLSLVWWSLCIMCVCWFVNVIFVLVSKLWMCWVFWCVRIVKSISISRLIFRWAAVDWVVLRESVWLWLLVVMVMKKKKMNRGFFGWLGVVVW